MILLAAAAAVYANSLSAPFVFDDDIAIVANESIRTLAGALTPPARGEPVAGRPIVNASFALNYALGGLDVRGFRAVNIALHALCALLIFGLIRRTLTLPSTRAAAPWAGSAATPIAFAAALIWTVHPLTSETINYVSQRTESLMSLFYLLTLYGGLRAVNDGRGWLAFAAAACAAGMACKETMATAPLLVVLYDRTFLFGSFRQAWRARRGFYVVLGSTWLLLLALIWSGPRWESAGFATGITPWTYLLNQAVMLVEYLRRIVWPAALVLDYGEPEAYTFVAVLPHAALVLALLLATAWALARRPMLGFLGAWFFVILAPTSSIVPIATEVGGDRRLYLPLAAAILPAILAARWLLARASITSALPAAALVAATTAVLSATTVARNAEYQDSLGLWERTLERWPSSRAHRNLATALKRGGRTREAIEHLRLALPGHPEVRYALGYELVLQGRHAEAVVELTQYLKDHPSGPDSPTAHSLLASALVTQQRYADAVPHYEAVARAQPQNARAWLMLGAVQGQADQFAQAEDAFRRSIALTPRNAEAHLFLGLMLDARGNPGEAVQHFRMAVDIDPSNAEARTHLERLGGGAQP